MLDLDISHLILLLSLSVILCFVSYSLYKGENRLKIVAWVLVYLGILPIFVDNAFAVPSAIVTPMLLFGLATMLIGFGLVWRVRE